MDAAVAEAVANEARRRDARYHLKTAEGQVVALEGVVTLVQQLGFNINASLSTAQSDVAAAQMEVDAAEAGGAGTTSEFGQYSPLEQRMRTERFAGKSAAIDYIKANADCAEADAIAAYEPAALAACPQSEQWLLQDAANLLQQYRVDAVKLGYTADSSWETFRALVVATDKTLLMEM